MKLPVICAVVGTLGLGGVRLGYLFFEKQVEFKSWVLDLYRARETRRYWDTVSDLWNGVNMVMDGEAVEGFTYQEDDGEELGDVTDGDAVRAQARVDEWAVWGTALPQNFNPGIYADIDPSVAGAERRALEEGPNRVTFVERAVKYLASVLGDDTRTSVKRDKIARRRLLDRTRRLAIIVSEVRVAKPGLRNTKVNRLLLETDIIPRVVRERHPSMRKKCVEWYTQAASAAYFAETSDSRLLRDWLELVPSAPPIDF
jgi:hypothetical protein